MMSHTTEKHSTSTKMQLIQAAISVFSEYGLKGATTKEIAKRANVHETTLFRHFETKELLLQAVMEQMSLEMTEALKLNHRWTDDLYQDLLAYGITFRDALIKNSALVRMFISEGSELQEKIQYLIQSSHLSFKEHIIAYLEQAKLLRQVRPELDSQKIVRVYTGIIIAAVLRGDMSAENKPINPTLAMTFVSLEECLDMLVQGIAIRS